jgi:tetratricopeptide (TPR) repeat protein
MNIIQITDSLSQKLINFLAISKLIKENPEYGRFPLSTHSPEAVRYFIYGDRAMGKFDLPNAIDFFSKAIDADSNFFAPMGELSMAYYNSGMVNKSRSLVIKLYGKIDQMSELDKLRTNQLYARFFQSPDVQIKYLKQLQEIDRQGNYHYTLATAYGKMKQPAKAISEMEKSLEISRKWGKEFLIGHYAYPALGEAYHRTGQYKKEKKLYREARRVNDDQRSIYFSWIIRDQASLVLTLGDTAEANRYIKELLSVLKENSFSEADIAHQMALMYKMAGNLDKAEEYGREELLSEPENPSRMNTLAWFLIDTGRNISEGLEITEKALALRPDNYEFLDTKGWGLYKQGNYKEALEILQKSWDLRREKAVYNHEPFLHLEAAKKAVAGLKTK